METFPAYVDETICDHAGGDEASAPLPPRRHAARELADRSADRDVARAEPVLQAVHALPRGDCGRGARAHARRRRREPITARDRPGVPDAQSVLHEGLPAGVLRPGRHLADPARRRGVSRTSSASTRRRASTPKEIHEIGLREVARIRGEMQATMEKTGLQGDAEGLLRRSCGPTRASSTRTPDDCSRAYRATAKRIDPLLVKLFKTLPRTPYGVEPDPRQRRARHDHGVLRRARRRTARAPGRTSSTSTSPESRPTWEMMALTLHESVPGHHLQIALAQEQRRRPGVSPPRRVHGVRRGVGALRRVARATRSACTTTRTRSSGSSRTRCGARCASWSTPGCTR